MKIATTTTTEKELESHTGNAITTFFLLFHKSHCK